MAGFKIYVKCFKKIPFTRISSGSPSIVSSSNAFCCLQEWILKGPVHNESNLLCWPSFAALASHFSTKDPTSKFGLEVFLSNQSSQSIDASSMNHVPFLSSLESLITRQASLALSHFLLSPTLSASIRQEF